VVELRFDPDAVESLRRRVRDTTWAPDLGRGWEAGVPGDELRRLAAYWADGFDFDAHERKVNAFEHRWAEIDGVEVHYLHRPGVGPSPMPLVLTHGWPWTFMDFAEVIGPLADPQAHGGDTDDAFEVVVPALPGYPWSPPPTRPVGFVETADLWRTLMVDVLGHERFGAHGGDSGAFVSAQLAHAHADVLTGAHLTFPALLGADLADAAARPDLQTHFLTHIFEPQTLAWAMHDSPVGMLAWMLHRRHHWGARPFTDDEVLLATTLYWLSGTFASSVHFYRASFGVPWAPRHDRRPTLEAPTGIAVFPGELLHVPQEVAAAHANLVHWTEMPSGGHFAPAEEPQLLVEDLRAFFRPLRTR
jgi:pimeloyl-ACP methyl ester carboxylesterase